MKIIAYRSTLCFIFCERRYGSDTDTREIKKQKNNKCHIQQELLFRWNLRDEQPSQHCNM